MGTIQVLSELVVNKIAAGEVVERPASVVKELLDNALDAGAACVSVAVSHGGKSSIRVTDDGSGMDEQDARACLIRHATSKISSLEDIQDITTMGFRGEALASIAAVSRLTITTRHRLADTAVIIKAEAGRIGSVSQGVQAPGTTIEVRDLFFNTPARRRFLKSDAAEYGAISEMFNMLALSRPDMAFSLKRGDVAAADYPACSGRRERIALVFGDEFAEYMYDFEMRADDFTVQGFIGAPDYTRVNRTGQKFFINGRPVSSAAINTALSRAYDEFLPARRFPTAVLFLTIAPESVDVNVHPAKREVRIRNERQFLERFTSAVRGDLRKKGFCFKPEGTQPSGDLLSLRAAETHAVFDSKGDSGWRASFAARPAADSGPDSRSDTKEFFSSPRFRPLLAAQERELPFDMTRIVGQLHACYIIVESTDGFFMIDQHAAHERIVYEELLDAMQRKTAVQQLLFPAALHLDTREASVLDQSRELFANMGFGLNDLGAGSFSIDAVPGCLMDCDAGQLLTDCLHELMESGRSVRFETRAQEVAAILACKTRAVKAGRDLAEEEQLHLIRELADCDNPHICPHGRPTLVRISRAEIEKRFLRS